MKKQTIKNLMFTKKTISSFSHFENVKGGVSIPNRSHTSCLCIDTVCECEIDTVR